MNVHSQCDELFHTLHPVNFKIAITGILFTLSTCFHNSGSDYQNAKREGGVNLFPHDLCGLLTKFYFPGLSHI